MFCIPCFVLAWTVWLLSTTLYEWMETEAQAITFSVAITSPGRRECGGNARTPLAHLQDSDDDNCVISLQ